VTYMKKFKEHIKKEIGPIICSECKKPMELYVDETPIVMMTTFGWELKIVWYFECKECNLWLDPTYHRDYFRRR